jgi:hypothetical protein
MHIHAHTFVSQRALGSLLAVALLALAGCGSDGGGEELGNDLDPSAGSGGAATVMVGTSGSGFDVSQGGSPGTVGAGSGGVANNHGGAGGGGGKPGAGGTGGASQGGGSSQGGAGGGPGVPHVVGECNALPAPGTWERISPPPWASSPKNEALTVVLSPDTSGVVYAAAGDKTNGGTGGTGLYKSKDCGATWIKVSTGAHGADLETGEAWDMAIDRNNGQLLYMVNGYGSPASLFRSENGGVDWTVLMPDGGTLAKAIGGNFVQHFSLDPVDGNHVVAVFHFNCTGAYAPMCMAETLDGGKTWRAFKGPTSGWSEGAAQPLILNKTTWVYPNGDALYYTKDSGATWEKVFGDGGGGHYIGQDGTIYLGGNSAILRSTDGHAWSSIPGSPKASGMTSDGNNFYASFCNDFSGKPMFTALQSAPTKWNNMPTPTLQHGAGFLAYDADHHVLYAAFFGAGLWRYVVK